MNNPLKTTYCFADGEYNTEGDIEATKDGIEIDLGIYISWEWIDAARRELTKPVVTHCPSIKASGSADIIPREQHPSGIQY